LADRPGALAALAQRCGDRDVNILGLQVFPGVDGVTDELVLRAPGGWGLADVAELVEDAGGRRVTVSPCTVHALHDAPTRYLQAARRLVDDPAALARVLAGVLDAQADDADPAMRAVQETIEVGSGSTIRRITPFTEIERARAAAFADLAERLLHRLGEADLGGGPAGPDAPVRPGDGAAPAIRLAQPTDVAAVLRMHERCSAVAILRRYHSPLPRIGRRMAGELISPSGGASLLAVLGSEVVGMATIAPYDGGTFELGVLVEETWQRRGIGSALVHQAARLARARGADDVVCLARRDDRAALPTIARAGLRGLLQVTDDRFVIRADVRRLRPLAVAPEAPSPAEIAVSAGPDG
jgi:GNAT superfamily N-acetyltransferase